MNENTSLSVSWYKIQLPFLHSASFSSFSALICGIVLKHALFIGLDIQCALCIVKFHINHSIIILCHGHLNSFSFKFHLYVPYIRGLGCENTTDCSGCLDFWSSRTEENRNQTQRRSMWMMWLFNMSQTGTCSMSLLKVYQCIV